MTEAVIDACAAARARLDEPPRRAGALSALAAAGLCAMAALLMAGAVILGPGPDFSAEARPVAEAPQGF